MAIKLTIWNKQMLVLMEHCKNTGLCSSEGEFCKSIGLSVTGITKIKAGVQSFTPAQLHTAAKVYKVNLNWIFGLDPNRVFAASQKKPLQQLKDAVLAVEVSMRK